MLKWYRAAVVVLAALVAILAALLYRAGPRPDAPPAGGPASAVPGSDPATRPVMIIDLAERVASLSRDHADQADTSQFYYRSPYATVHLHLLGRRQRTPLHVHRRSHEATVIVSGTAWVLQVFGRNGSTARREGRHGPGSLIASPPLSGHAWRNPAPDDTQANLVFATPPFDGNLYLEADDPLLQKGAEPLTYDPDLALENFLEGGERHRLRPLPALQGAMFELLAVDPVRVEPHAEPVMAYVLRGEAILAVEGEHAVGPRHLVWIPAGKSLEVRPGGDAPVALLLFRIPGPSAG